MTTVEQLVEMGFEKERAERAVELTSGQLEAAMEWLIAHEGEALPPRLTAEVQSPAEGVTAEATVAQMNSYKCNDCDKLFRDMDALMFHATKSGHENFSESSEEIKPLTEEERKQKSEELLVRIKAAQAKKAEIERKEALEKEKRRREDGKKMLENREQQKDQELRAIAEERRRAKVEEQEAKNRILEQIRLDKEARKARQMGQQPPEPSVPQHVAVPVAKVDYDQATIQIRLPNGQAVKQTFAADEPLSAVRLWLELNHSDNQPFRLLVPFPRKEFAVEDYDAPLKALGLVPSASIVMTR